MVIHSVRILFHFTVLERERENSYVILSFAEILHVLERFSPNNTLKCGDLLSEKKLINEIIKIN